MGTQNKVKKFPRHKAPAYSGRKYPKKSRRVQPKWLWDAENHNPDFDRLNNEKG